MLLPSFGVWLAAPRRGNHTGGAMRGKLRRFTRQSACNSLLLTLLLICIRPALGEHRYILHAPASSVAAIASRHGLTVGSDTDAEGVSLVLTSDSRTADQVVNELQADPDVNHVELDSGIQIPETSSSSQPGPSAAAIQFALAGRNLVSYFGSRVWQSYTMQPATGLIGLSKAQALSMTGGAIVAVIDTGIDPGQPAFQGLLVPGYDFVHNTAGIDSEWTDLDPATAAQLGPAAAPAVPLQLSQSTAAILDQSTAAILDITHIPPAFGHGTMVAGVIHLAAPTARIMPIKVFAADGTANLVDIVRAIYFAVDNGAQVINMSFSMAGFSLELMKAVNYATLHNVVLVGSVGNSGSETIAYPASFHNVLGVASTDGLDKKSIFSNYGAALANIAAPGQDIITTYPGGNYAVVSGTSFAAPFVSAGAALVLQADPNADLTDMNQAFSQSKKLGADLGYGRLDLYETLESVLKH